jgi:hypothetical protein
MVLCECVAGSFEFGKEPSGSMNAGTMSTS